MIGAAASLPGCSSALRPSRTNANFAAGTRTLDQFAVFAAMLQADEVDEAVVHKIAAGEASD